MESEHHNDPALVAWRAIEHQAGEALEALRREVAPFLDCSLLKAAPAFGPDGRIYEVSLLPRVRIPRGPRVGRVAALAHRVKRQKRPPATRPR